ncbi:ABC transporter ATP-binding protein [Hanamia caeni]|jgi:ABC-type multidrug transport system ATPase subunit|uniref:ABC transporter ATP-binding protein n=1 Tax=Hanamia caeni TaxID=2294116 RepID=A0A3M9N9P4_9BACT|nr:ABC transporter ATP-binding protein [Hanamia caeni]RNI34520.1 ABC transporter ATP-binding protein [Hanamia caeni]
MKISLTKIGKRYNHDWIFRNLDFDFHAKKHYAIIGPNGSGKSTLLQIISGATIFNEGKISYVENDTAIVSENIFQKIAFAAPYLEVIEEMTLTEFFTFHQKMKGWLEGLDTQKIIEVSGLKNAAHKQIRYYSSGMKQRVKIAQAILSNVPIILLDEPLTNLDEEGILLYHELIKKFCHNRLLIVSSNDKNEYSFCDEILDIRIYK